MLPDQWAFVLGIATGAFIGIFTGFHMAWWFLFPAYRRQWQPQPRRPDRRGRWS